MNMIALKFFLFRRTGMACCFASALVLVGCSSSPDPEPQPTKEEIRQDADRFFQKMEQEKGK